MENTQWWTYVAQLIEGDTYKEAATKAGFDKSAFTRWKRGARADPDFAVKLARAYGVDVLEALVAAEFITEEEAGQASANSKTEREVRKTLSALENAGADYVKATENLSKIFSNPSIAQALTTMRGPTVAEIMDSVIQRTDPARAIQKNISAITKIATTPADELATRRKAQRGSSSADVGDMPVEGMPEDAVAYGHDLIGGTADDFES